MAVFFYAEGQHPSGFVGYRVATTLGACSEFRQMYYSLSQYSVSEAHRRAEALNEKWRNEADGNVRERAISQGRRTAGIGSIATGLRATFRVTRGKKAHHTDTIRAMFVVVEPGYGAGIKRFYPLHLGFDAAFDAAVDHYCTIHQLTPAERAVVYANKPAPTVFTVDLRLQLMGKGIVITENAVKAQLGL